MGYQDKINQNFIFLCGLHKSGTSLLHEILRSHPDISGFEKTGAPEDEGQHLQSVYLPARAFGGPGLFGFNKSSFMDERHPLAIESNAEKIFSEWKNYFEVEKRFLIEKSPPNLVRTRFFQKLFPQAIFITILRHPLAIAYATKKWRNLITINILIEHSLRCYERFYYDFEHLNKVLVIRYEELVNNTKETIEGIFEWIGIDSIRVLKNVRSDVNGKYFQAYQKDLENPIIKRVLGLSKLTDKYEKRANLFGYSIKNIEALLPINWSKNLQ